jgi:hypothetical protein
MLRMTRCGDHYIFGVPRGDAPTSIVAIFHERNGLDGATADRQNK